jgi:hypothetical protein
MTVVGVCLVVGALLAAVVGQALLANGQVRLSTLQDQLSLEQAVHRQNELSVAQLETPARIVAAASNQGMVGSTVTELPYVPLTVPLATPQVTPAPAPPPPPATTSATSGNTGNTGNTGSAGSAPSSSTTPTSTP